MRGNERKGWKKRKKKRKKDIEGKLTGDGALGPLKQTEEGRGRKIHSGPRKTEREGEPRPVVLRRYNTQSSRADNLSTAQDSAPWPPPAPPPSHCSLEVSLLPRRVVNKVGQTAYS